MATGSDTHYDTLQVSTTADAEAIRLAFIALNEKFRFTGEALDGAEKRARINSAFVVLSDPKLRAQYDAQLKDHTSSDSQDVRSAHRALETFLKRPRAELAQAAFEEGTWAGFWARVAAQWIDSFILYFVVAGLMAVVGVIAAASTNGSGTQAVGILVLVLVFVVPVLYATVFLGSDKVATPGRMAAGIAVVDAETGQPIGFGRAGMRGFLSLVSNILVLPNLVQPFTKRRQSLSDLLCGTVVVRFKPGASGVVVTVVALLVGTSIIGILAAIAIPAYDDYVKRAKIAQARADLAAVAPLVEAFAKREHRVPSTLDELGFKPSRLENQYSVDDQANLFANVDGAKGKATGVIRLEPHLSTDGSTVVWQCFATGFRRSAVPKDCVAY